MADALSWERGIHAKRLLTDMRNHLFAVAEVAAREQRYGDALDGYFGMLFIDGLGLPTPNADMSGFHWRLPPNRLAGGILRRAAKCINTLGLAPGALSHRFMSQADALGRLRLSDDCLTARTIWSEVEPLLLEQVGYGSRWRPRRPSA